MHHKIITFFNRPKINPLFCINIHILLYFLLSSKKSLYPESEKIPYILYNLGGILANLALSLISFLFILINQDFSSVVSFVLMIFSSIGLIMAISNGIPFRTQVMNDGRNIMDIKQCIEARIAFYYQMKINAILHITNLRLKDMNEEWFKNINEPTTKSIMCCSITYLHCSRIMDQGNFNDAYYSIENLLNKEKALLPLYRNLLKVDL